MLKQETFMFLLHSAFRQTVDNVNLCEMVILKYQKSYTRSWFKGKKKSHFTLPPFSLWDRMKAVEVTVLEQLTGQQLRMGESLSPSSHPVICAVFRVRRENKQVPGLMSLVPSMKIIPWNRNVCSYNGRQALACDFQFSDFRAEVMDITAYSSPGRCL